MRRALALLAGPAVALLIFLALGEALARAVGVVDRLNGYSRALLAPGPDADLPYVLRPHVETRLLGTTVRVNALGLRGPELRPSPPALRVLALGDSVVFGWGVAEDDTLAARLEAELAARGADAEVLNAGVQGYDAVAEAALLGRLAPVVRPRFVVVGMSLNDYERPPRYHPLGILARDDAAGESLAERSEFLLLLRWGWTWLHGGLWHQQVAQFADRGATSVAPVDRAVAAAHRRFYEAPDAEAWARIATGMRRLRQRTAADRVPLLVAIFPESWQLDDVPGARGPQHRLLALCAAEDVACLDLLPAFRAAGGALFLDTQHPNAAGQAVAARAIADVMATPERP